MLTVIVVPGMAAKEAALRIQERLGLHPEIQEEVHRIIYEVLKKFNISE